MYHVLRKGADLNSYHAKYESLQLAQEYAQGLKATYGHNYEIIKVETVWTTTTMADLLAEDPHHRQMIRGA